jgi:hypothetical protein
MIKNLIKDYNNGKHWRTVVEGHYDEKVEPLIHQKVEKKNILDKDFENLMLSDNLISSHFKRPKGILGRIFFDCGYGDVAF